MSTSLRRARERAFLTQEELAEKAKLSRTTITKLENGSQQPRARTVRLLARALGMPPAELMRRDDH